MLHAAICLNCGFASVFLFTCLNCLPKLLNNMLLHLQLLLPAGLPQSGKLPVLNLLTGHKSGFSPHRGDSLHQCRSNLAGPTGTGVRLAVQYFTSIGAGGGVWECGHKNIKNFHFLVESPLRVTPLTDFKFFYGLLYA